MRVVCDNCGAVYKIADAKLSKEVNRATCKRCGHKIIIFRPGSQAAHEAAAHRGPGVEVGDDDERTVIKSVPELQKMANKQGVPSIGSLTAELRAISIPGIQSVGGPTPAPPQTLGPAGPMAGDSRAPAPKPIAPPPTQPKVIPATTIPPSDSPKTKVYDGPSPHLGGMGGQTQAPTPPPKQPVPARSDSTRPMPLPTPTGPVPSNGGPGPGVHAGGPAPIRTPPVSTIGAPSTSVAPVAETGSSVLGGVAVFSMVGVVGLIAAIYVPAPASTFAILLAALGLFGCFFLALLTARGRKPERSLIALILAFMLALGVGALEFVATDGLDAFDPEPTPAVLKPVPPKVEPTPIVDPGVAAELNPGELEEVERYSDRDLGGLGGREPEVTPTKESKRDVVTRPTPTPRPASTPRPTPAPTPAPTPDPGPARADLPPPPSGSGDSGKTGGPSPFVIDTIIRNNASIVRCLRVEGSKGVDLAGKIYLKFTVSPGGGVSKARITTSRFAGTSLDSCISSELNSLTFPPFDGTAKKITYPLIVQ
jgi:predicted Zn finger-like uncharacterized protein